MTLRPTLGLLAVTVLLLIAAAPTAEAQAAPTAAITFRELPTGAVETNQSLYVDLFQVQLELDNLICPQAAQFVVALKGSGAQNGTGNGSVAYRFNPAVASFTVNANQYLASPYSGQAEMTFITEPASIPDRGMALRVTVEASLPADNRGCVAAGTVPAATQSASFDVRFLRGTEPPAPLPPSPAMPGPGVWLALAAAAVGLAVSRRPGR